MSAEFLIVGQGLAGSLIAYQLIKRDRRVKVLDPGQENASQVAAGLVNPVTGPRLTLASDTPRYLAKARQTYAELSGLLNAPLWRDLSFIRLLADNKALKQAEKRLLTPDYQPFLGNFQRLPASGPFLGQIEQFQAGQLDTRRLLSRFRAYLKARNSYSNERLDYRDIQLSPLRWRGQPFQAIIFCEGFNVLNNPWFQGLPLRPAKGEILRLRPARAPETLIHFGYWLLPETDGQVSVGATFAPRTLDTRPTASARQKLLSGLCRVAPELAQAPVVGQRAQIRPGSHDRTPYLGPHPAHEGLWLFNGLGAKGSMQGPALSEYLADALLAGQPIPGHLSLNRHKRLS